MLEIDSLEDVAALRESLDIELEGGESDCQNRALHEMFLLIGLGERAGSGLSKIQQGWTEQGHSSVLYDSLTPYDQTVVELTWGALDTMYINAIALLVLFGIHQGNNLYFEAALLIAVMGFVGTVALSKYLLRGDIIE